MKSARILTILVVALGLVVCQAEVSEAAPMGTAFTYQGHLYDANHVADGLYDFQFKLFDANVAGSQKGSDVNKPDVDVISAYFTVELDFGSVFEGDDVWLQIGVRPGELNDSNAYTTLSPRQEVTATPYALYAKNAGADDDWTGAGTGSMYTTHLTDNVGIGTTNPVEMLDLCRSDGNGNVAIRLDSFGAAEYRIGLLDSDNKLYITNNDGPTDLGASTEGIIIDQDGKVGIGTTEPQELLNVYGDRSIIRLTSTKADPTAAMCFHDDSIQIGYVGDGGTGQVIDLSGQSGYDVGICAGPRRVIIKSDTGNVGIGTPSPGAKLTVNGAILRSGSTMYGSNADTHINLGTNSTTGTSGADYGSATVGGGGNNTASGFHATVSGGQGNIASDYASVSGGVDNIASGSHATVSGGQGNIASDYAASVPGGGLNEANGAYSLAAGYRAKANHNGTFVWADWTGEDFASTAGGQFLIRAYGGVGIGTTSPAYDLDVNGSIRAIGSVYYGGTEGNADAILYDKPDYVFEKGYDVMSIDQVEEYLKKENHLPWMTSTKQEKEENGDVIDMTRMAFETVETAENLQMQLIELNKQNKALEKRVEALEKMIAQQQFVSEKEVYDETH